MIQDIINPQDIIFSLDIGTRSVIGTAGIVKDKKFHVIAESYVEHEKRAMIDGQIHDINLVAAAVNSVKKDIEEKIDTPLKNVAIAAAGRFLKTITSKSEIEIDSDKEITKDMIRSLEMTAVNGAEEEINKQKEGKMYCVGYSVINYFLNGYIISNLLSHKGEKISAEVIATFLPKSVVESLYSVTQKVGLNVTSLTLEPIAAMEAAIPQKLRLLNLALIDIGAGTSDIAISSEDTISAYGMVPMAGDEVTEVIAKNYLTDFNTAEKIKRECSVKEKVKFTDIMGLENEISGKDIIEIISPMIKKICEEVGNKIIELNGGKSPTAVFLVGGGAHTPGIKDFLSQKLGIPLQRIGIKGREAVSDCICPDNTLGSEGVTVLGIALVSIKKTGNDFIDVMLNDQVISLFNSHKHTVMDVMIQSGINPKLLIGRSGKNIRFELNGNNRIAFGTLEESPVITINGKTGSIDSEVKEGDKIEIVFAKNGKDAVPQVKDYIQKIYNVIFRINEEQVTFQPIAYINGSAAGMDDFINEGDKLNIIYPETIKDYKKLFSQSSEDCIYVKDEKELNDSYIIEDGDKIYKKVKPCEEKINALHNETDKIKETKETKEIKVNVNEKEIVMRDKKSYIFVDVFNYIKFDLSYSKGRLVLKLNDKKAGYNDELKNGDKINIYWDDNKI